MAELIDLEGLTDEELNRVKDFIADLKQGKQKTKNEKTAKFLELSGTWQDDRTTEEIIKEIYESRTFGRGEIVL